MKNQPNLRKYAHGIFFTILTICSINAAAQQTLIKVNGWNAYVHLPSDYDQTTKNYPTILFIPGLGEVGTDANKLISNGPGAYIKQGWNGETFGVKFIVISLQPPAAWPRHPDVKLRVDELKTKYRIGDLYVTGLSMGGYGCTGLSMNYPGFVKGYVGVEAISYYEGTQLEGYAKSVAEAGQKYLLFEQVQDYRGSQLLGGLLNKWKPGAAHVEMTNFGGGGHCCWSSFYGGGGNQPSDFSVDGQYINIYEWFAQEAMVAGVLPVTIEGFNAQPFGNAVGLSWNTSSELNSRYFEIQRSTDGKNFRKLGVVSAAGNSNVLQQYTFHDELPENGNNFYRLKTVDLDGKYEMSKTVNVQVKMAKSMLLESSAINRQAGRLTLDLKSADNAAANIFITDINGRIFYRAEKNIIEGNNHINDRISLPGKGIYYLRISSGQNLITKPLFSE